MVNLRNLQQWIIVVFLVSAMVPDGLAITRSWDGEGDGITWQDGLNWDPDGIPGVGDDADVGDATPLIAGGELFMIADLDVGDDGGVDIQGALNATGGTIDNNGAILVDHGIASGSASFGVGVGTLEGSGEVVLGETPSGSGGATLAGPAVGGSATHVAGHTIRGEGTITGNWINNGLIMPEDISGDSTGTLRIQGSMTNNGELRSSATANLDLNTGVNAINQGITGRIISDTRKITLRPSTIAGGTLEAVNGGYFEISANSLPSAQSGENRFGPGWRVGSYDHHRWRRHHQRWHNCRQGRCSSWRSYNCVFRAG
jgi:hypothetical protein